MPAGYRMPLPVGAEVSFFQQGCLATQQFFPVMDSFFTTLNKWTGF